MSSTPLLLCLLCFVLVASCTESIIQEVTDTQRLGDLRTNRERPPASFFLIVNSFSTMVKSQKERYESHLFETGGHKWRFVLYPNGNKKDNGTGYISLYLAIDASTFVPHHREVYADVKFLVYDKPEDRFLAVQGGEIRRFHVVRTEWGLSQFLPFSTFNDTTKGYLVDDSCVFGVEVFVVEPAEQWEEFSVINPTSGNAKFTWELAGFSRLDNEFYLSKTFTVADSDWGLKVYPRGFATGKGNSLSIYLMAYGNEAPELRSTAIYAKYKLRVLDRRGSKHVEREYTYWFSYPDSWDNGRGDHEFLPLTDLRNTSKGYLVNDTLVVETEISEISMTKYLP